MQRYNIKIKALAALTFILTAVVIFSSCAKIVSLTPLPLKAVIFSKSKEDSILYNDLQAEILANKSYNLQVQNFSAQTLAEDIKAAVQSGALAIVLQATSEEDSEQALAQAIVQNIPLIITGEKPSNKLMESYDKVWFLGTDAKNAGEQLGTVIAQKFKDGEILDVNSDGILQLAVMNGVGEKASNSAIVRCADLGVFSQNETKFSQLLSEGEGYSAILDSLNADTTIEAIFAQPEHNARAAVGATIGLEAAVPVFAVGDETQLKDIDDEGKLSAIAAYPDKKIASAINSFLINIFKGEDVTNNTDISLSSHRTVMFAYELMQ